MTKEPSKQRGFWTPARVLRGAVTLFAVLGIGMIVWLVDKAVQFPDVRARQFRRFGEAVPLWEPLILFVALSMACIVYLFWRAARRVESGEDLYEQRHRRRPDA